MRKVYLIARREFLATVATKAFLFGLLFLPLMIVIGAVLVPRLLDSNDFRVSGEISVIDNSGVVMSRLRDALTDGTAAARSAAATRAASADAATADLVSEALAMAPELSLRERPIDADIAREKAWLLTELDDGPRRLAVAVIQSDAVETAPGQTAYGSYELYLPPSLDPRAEIAVHQVLRDSIVSARIAAQGLDGDTIRGLMNIPRVQATTVTAAAETRRVSGFNYMLPMAFMMLLFIGVMGGGQVLMTSTVEEKSTRVIEVLLSAVSPMELMAGKLLGQMTVGLLSMTVYIVLGLIMLTSFSLFGLLEPLLILYLFVFFLITYFMVGSAMMAVGAAVNDMSETQSMMMPIMLLLMSPWFLFAPITRDPDSTFSTVISIVPPINCFTMIMRLASSSPPPFWQVALSIVIGIATVYGVVWFAAKVFRIGLLLHGKPPDFATLIHWIRTA